MSYASRVRAAEDAEDERLSRAANAAKAPRAEALYAEVVERNFDHRLDMLELALGQFVEKGREVTAEEEALAWKAMGHEPAVAMPELREAEDGRAMQQVQDSAALEPQEREPRAMGSMDDIYGGNTLKAEELPENFRAVVTVESVSVQEFEGREGKGPEKKLVLRFKGKDRGLALNVTNANMMAEIAKTRDYDYWPGHQALLYRTMTDFAGRRVPALRLDHAMSGLGPTQAAPPRVAAPPPPPPPAAAPFVADSDDVPFIVLLTGLASMGAFLA